MRTKHNGHSKKVGRPTSYKPEYAPLAQKIVTATGCTNRELAECLGIGRTTLDLWVKKHEEFMVAIKDGWYAHTNKQCEKSLRKLALGLVEYDEVSEEAIVLMKDGEERLFVEEKVSVRNPPMKDKNGRTARTTYHTECQLVEGTKRKITHKKLAPNLGALTFWMCNRSDKWDNPQRTIIEGKMEHTHEKKDIDYDKLSKEELFAVRDKMVKALSEKSKEETEQPLPKHEPAMN